jgi:hypothetical protein
LDDQEAPQWEIFKTRLLGMQDGTSLSLNVDDDTWLVVLYIADVGYLVGGCALGDRDYYSLIESSLGDDPVTAFDGGNTNEYPRFAFVSQAVLLKAVETYYLTGQRDVSCEWVLAQDAVY